jgi:hypothetical protein
MYFEGLGQSLRLAILWLHGLESVASRVQLASDTRILCAVEATKALNMRLHFA